MSIVADQVRRLDAQLDRIPFSQVTSSDEEDFTPQVASDLESPRVNDLLRVIKTLSTNSGSKPRLSESQLRGLLFQTKLLAEHHGSFTVNQYESELEWLLVSKATIQTYGVILDTLLDQIVPLSDHLWYWDEVLSSSTYSTLFMAQTSPWRLWAWTLDIYEDSKARLQRYTSGRTSAESTEGDESPVPRPTGLSHRWGQFYGIVRETIRERSLANVQRRIMSPVAVARAEARRKQARLKKLREMTSSGLGVLIDEALVFGGNGSEDAKSDLIASGTQEWRGIVERSVALMDMILQDALSLDLNIPQFEDKVFAGVDEDPELSIQAEEAEANRPAIVARRLHRLLTEQVPEHRAAVRTIVKRNGRPPRLVRYWLPATALLLSSGTIYRIFVNRQEEILQWVRDLGVTVRDFWFNWVIEPVRKVVGTIRHDANSEIAIMSRDSLKADRDSLERMVVDFALDRPVVATGESSLSKAQVAEIRAKVKEGDLTPVLRAYENDLRSPLRGTIRGDLVRTLLIQVQKTKVDVEVAMSGIDSLLKSQELVFGFVGLTPGILVSLGVAQYLRGLFGGRKGMDKTRRADRCVRVLRNIDRIFSEATASPPPNNVLQYKDHGLLISEVHVLRRLAHRLLPKDIEKEFLEDLDDLANLKGIGSQLRALDRIRWAYSKWLK
ncbi:hypothetical protein DL768_011720 [Monosporascus sp. mg162]|nr:hypothetical protein DL768_011720 [Monosporascus sp. mg162]